MRTFILGLILGIIGGIGLNLYVPTKALIDTHIASQFDFAFTHTALLPLDADDTHIPATTLADYAIEPCFPRSLVEPLDVRPWLIRDIGAQGLFAREDLPPSPDLADYPGLVKIEGIRSPLGTEREHCAAARISEHWFLTAAHCIVDLDIRTARPTFDVIAITPSADVRSPETQIVPLMGAVCHAAYGMNRQQYPNDIALFYVEDVSAFEAVDIARLETPDGGLLPRDMVQTYVSGWGKNGGTRFLQGGPVRIIEAGEAVLIGERIGPKGPNVGDSGAPLYATTPDGPVVLGVLSQVTQDANQDGDRSIYIRSRAVSDWVERTMAICEQNDTYVCGPPQFAPVEEN